MLTTLVMLCGCGETITPSGVIVVDRRPHPDHGLYLLQGQTREALFTAAPLGHLLQITYSRTRGQSIFSYAPPPRSGQPSNLSASLYTMAVTAGAIPQVFIPAGKNEVLLDPVFSPDSSQLYWVKATAPGNADPDNSAKAAGLQLNVTNLADMSTSTLLSNAIWPAPSADGQHLAFVAVDPRTLLRGLSVYEFASGQITELIEIGRFDDIDAPVFSDDGNWVYFFGPALTSPASLIDQWLDWLGVNMAYAHINRPGVWWKISSTGKDLQSVTTDTEIISNASSAEAGVLTYTSSLGVRVLSEHGVQTLSPEPYFGGVAEYAE